MAGSSETGAQLFARLGSRPSLEGLCPDLFSDAFPKPGQLMELCGDNGTAKTEILLNLLATCILPPKWRDFRIGGIGTGVVFVDTNYQFSMLRIFSILEKKVMDAVKTQPKVDVKERPADTSADQGGLDSDMEGANDMPEKTPDVTEVESFIKMCLEKLYLIRCNSSQQLLITLHSLENVFANRSEMSVLMVDSWSAFYWMDRAGFGDQASLLNDSQINLTKALGKLIDENQITAFVTKRISIRSGVKTESSLNAMTGSPSSRQVPAGEKLLNCQELGTKDWKKIVSQRFFLERSERTISPVVESKSVNSRPRELFTATRVLPEPVKTVGFLVSSKGCDFNVA